MTVTAASVVPLYGVWARSPGDALMALTDLLEAEHAAPVGRPSLRPGWLLTGMSSWERVHIAEVRAFPIAPPAPPVRRRFWSRRRA